MCLFPTTNLLFCTKNGLCRMYSSSKFIESFNQNLSRILARRPWNLLTNVRRCALMKTAKIIAGPIVNTTRDTRNALGSMYLRSKCIIKSVGEFTSWIFLSKGKSSSRCRTSAFRSLLLGVFVTKKSLLRTCHLLPHLGLLEKFWFRNISPNL